MAKTDPGSGDEGYTGLLGGGRVPKYDLRPEAYGALDEASAALGMARVHCRAPESAPLILAVQRDLYHLMAEVAATRENAAHFRKIDADRVAWLERESGALTTRVTVPSEFVVPGDSLAGAALDVARTTVRRAERAVARLWHAGELENRELLRYINRLSSLCLHLELLENKVAGVESPTLAKG